MRLVYGYEGHFPPFDADSHVASGSTRHELLADLLRGSDGFFDDKVTQVEVSYVVSFHWRRVTFHLRIQCRPLLASQLGD